MQAVSDVVQSRSSPGGRDRRYNSKYGGHNCILLTIYIRIHHLYRRLLNSQPASLHDSNTSDLLDRWSIPCYLIWGPITVMVCALRKIFPYRKLAVDREHLFRKCDNRGLLAIRGMNEWYKDSKNAQRLTRIKLGRCV